MFSVAGLLFTPSFFVVGGHAPFPGQADGMFGLFEDCGDLSRSGLLFRFDCSLFDEDCCCDSILAESKGDDKLLNRRTGSFVLPMRRILDVLP